MKDELTDFLRFCAVERRLAPLTCAAYKRDVSACLGYLQGQGLADLAEVRPTDLRAFLAEDAKRRPAPSSQARATAALKSFFRFLVDDEQLERDPARPLRTPKKREALPDVLTMAELERLLAAPGTRRSLGAALPRQGRARPTPARPLRLRGPAPELLGLAWDDVDLSRRLLYVRKAKGGRQRVVPIHPALAPLFGAYYATRVPLIEQALFVGVQGKPLNYTQLGQVFRHYVASSGIGERKRVTPHTLRHVFASELLRAGANLRQVQELLGHKHLDSTQRYTRVTAHELRGAVKRLRWVG
ncbi:MAG: tyrosine-type recombinase/integrase [Gaiellaceae bacterium]